MEQAEGGRGPQVPEGSQDTVMVEHQTEKPRYCGQGNALLPLTLTLGHPQPAGPTPESSAGILPAHHSLANSVGNGVHELTTLQS